MAKVIQKKTFFKSGIQAAEAGRRGGMKSVIVKKEKKCAKDILDNLLDRTADKASIKKLSKYYGISGEQVTNNFVIISKMVELAKEGNIKAIEMVLDRAMGKPFNALQVPPEEAGVIDVPRIESPQEWIERNKKDQENMVIVNET